MPHCAKTGPSGGAHRVHDRPQQPAIKRPPIPSLDDIFGDSEPLQSAEDLAQDGIFDDGEVEEFIADLYAMRRSDVA